MRKPALNSPRERRKVGDRTREKQEPHTEHSSDHKKGEKEGEAKKKAGVGEQGRRGKKRFQ